MISEKDKAEERNLVAGTGSLQQGQKLFPVTLITEDPPSLVSPRQQMINRSRKFDPERPRHRSASSQSLQCQMYRRDPSGPRRLDPALSVKSGQP